jgi:hypothetical protein
MKFVVAISLILALPAMAVAADEDVQARLDSQAQSCIASNAIEVVRAEPNLSSAVEFLTNDLCARAIEVAEKYRLNRKVLDILIRQQKATMAMMPSPPPQAVAPTPMAGGSAPVATDRMQKAAAAKEAKLAGLEAARISPETGELEGLPSPYSMITDLANLVLNARAPPASAKLKAFAAHAVLAAREAKP